jgi:FMN reductase (NADPH)
MAKMPFLDFLQGLARIIGARPRLPRSLVGNELLTTLLERRSVRKFRSDPILDDAWQAILEAGRLAPSTVNLQTWSFITFTNDQWRELFGRTLPFGAPQAVVVAADVHRAKGVVEGFPYAPLCEYTVGVMNASLAAMNMTIAAEALGISSCMLSETGQSGFYDARHLAESLGFPAGVVPIMTIVFGHAKSGRPAMPPKLPPEAVAFPGQYREAPQEVLDDWYNQMKAGYQASNWGERFASQVAHYNRRIEDAESDLRDLVFYEGEEFGP